MRPSDPFSHRSSAAATFAPARAWTSPSWAGLAWNIDSKTGRELSRVFPDGSTTRHEGSSSSNYTWTSAPLGIDASIVLTPHLAVVPQLRFRFEPLWFLNDGCCGGSQSAGRLTLRLEILNPTARLPHCPTAPLPH